MSVSSVSAPVGRRVGSKAAILSVSFAMFAMFFGAGNIVFPLTVGMEAQDQNLFASIGMMLTAVLVPLMGLVTMMLYEGDYHAFFQRIGKIPGFLMTACILGLIGPFGAIPRCITISYSTLCAFGVDQIPGFNLISFGFFSALLIFFFAFRPSNIINWIGKILTPILMVSLLIIVVRGLFVLPDCAVSSQSKIACFGLGLIGGYNTMDLLAAFFFASVVLVGLKSKVGSGEKSFLSVALTGGVIAALMLGLVYLAFTCLAAGFYGTLEGVNGHEMLGALTFQLLGPYAGMVAGVAVCFACLTTEIALAAVFAEFFHRHLVRGKLSYSLGLGMTVLISFLISTLHFEGISSFLVPILQVCYPGLIVLTVLNLLHKLWGVQMVKLPVYFTFLVSGVLFLLK